MLVQAAASLQNRVLQKLFSDPDGWQHEILSTAKHSTPKWKHWRYVILSVLRRLCFAESVLKLPFCQHKQQSKSIIKMNLLD